MNQMDDKTLLAMLQSHDDTIVNKGVTLLYKQYYRLLASMVTKNQGSTDEAQDLFQESLVELLQKVRKSNFALTGKLMSLFFLIGKNRWLKTLRGRKGMGVTINWEDAQIPEAVEEMNVLEKEQEYSEAEKIIADILKSMGGNCPKIIVMKVQEEKSHEEIAEILGITKDTSKVNLSRCMKSFRNLIDNHPFFKG